MSLFLVFCLTAFMNVLKIFFIKQLNHGQKLSAHGRPSKNRIGPAHPEALTDTFIIHAIVSRG